MTSETYAYQAAAVRSADSVELVIMLHDMLIEDLRRAIAGTRSADILARTTETSHALLVLDQLQRGLDLTRGGEAAHQMARLYTLARLALLRAQVEANASLFEAQMTMFISLRDAWRQAQVNCSTPVLRSPEPGLSDEDQVRAWTV